MGQLALGFRSLLVKLAVFFVMAALLAWALGGTLWPRSETVDFAGVPFDGREWFRRLTVGGREGPGARWSIMVRDAHERRARPFEPATWVELTDPVAGADAVYFGAAQEGTEGMAWRLERIDRGGARRTIELPDRLAVERELEQVRSGALRGGAP
jgi:hypothetical protein